MGSAHHFRGLAGYGSVAKAKAVTSRMSDDRSTGAALYAWMSWSCARALVVGVADRLTPPGLPLEVRGGAKAKLRPLNSVFAFKQKTGSWRSEPD